MTRRPHAARRGALRLGVGLGLGAVLPVALLVVAPAVAIIGLLQDPRRCPSGA